MTTYKRAFEMAAEMSETVYDHCTNAMAVCFIDGASGDVIAQIADEMRDDCSDEMVAHAIKAAAAVKAVRK
jgi:propanediol dehydratase small subunit